MMVNPRKLQFLSVIAPVYRNESHLERLYEGLIATLSTLEGLDRFEILFVDDGSPDAAWQVIEKLCSKDSRVIGIKLSRNFGQHHALTAGIDACRGDCAVIMDADGQDPPEGIKLLWNEAKNGFNVVNARRTQRKDPLYRVIASHLYQRLFCFLSGFDYDKDVANFRLIDRKVIEALKTMREAFRGFPLHVHWLGFSRTTIDMPHPARWSGKSSYSLRKLLSLALDVAVAYSNKPLRISIAFGLGISVFSLSIMLIYFARVLFYGIPVPGWASLIISIWFFSGMILANIGVVGIYISQILNETRHRPLYVIDEVLNRHGL
jgi:dolichol-phosphate mannosyltransferase